MIYKILSYQELRKIVLFIADTIRDKGRDGVNDYMAITIGITFLNQLGIYKDARFYSKETNSIISDAKKTEVFIHELGHMIYDNRINININKKIKGMDIEDYAKNFSLLLRR